MATHPNVLRPKTHIQHTHSQHLSISTHATTNDKSTVTGWGKQETLMATYKVPYGRLLHPRPALTNCKSCRMQHLELPQDAHKTQTYNICMTKHSYFPYTSTYSSTRHNTNKYTTSITPLTQTYNILQHSKAKNTIFNNGRYTTNISTDPHTITDIKTNMRHIHTFIVSVHLATRSNSKILRTPPPHISSSKEILPRLTRCTIAQLRTNKSPFLKSYLHNVDAKSHPSPLCPLCNTHTHHTHHLFKCSLIRTTLSPLDLWTDPAGEAALLAR